MNIFAPYDLYCKEEDEKGQATDMNAYRIFTDSSSDLGAQLLAEWDVSVAQLTLRFGERGDEYKNSEIDTAEFYRRMRASESAFTSAVSPGSFLSLFESALSHGEDVLYIGFSSALSGTYHNASLAARELAPRYPDRRIYLVDSLSASAGLGMLVTLAAEGRAEGRTLSDLVPYLEGIRHRICHLFTVDDLTYLRRGGRISRTSAAVGNLLAIKPILHVDESGRLVPIDRVRGRRAAIHALVDRYGAAAEDARGGRVYISHADDLGAAQALSSLLSERYGCAPARITNVGPVIGAHAGPGTLALFFLGHTR